MMKAERKWVNPAEELAKSHTVMYKVLYVATGADHADGGYCSGADAEEDESRMSKLDYEKRHILYILTSEPIKKKKRLNFTNESCSTKYGSHYCDNYKQHFVALEFNQVDKINNLCDFNTIKLRKYVICAFYQ
jgi:hypothetical protein